MRDCLTHVRLLEVLAYDADTGAFTWRFAVSPFVSAGATAGTIDKDGYRVIKIDGAIYKAHRLAWFYVHGVHPDSEIDHENTRRADNWIANLRPSSRRLNIQNQRKAHSNNKSGFLGVSKTRGGRWIARILVDGRKRYLSTFTRPELAHAAYVAAKRDLHPGATL